MNKPSTLERRLAHRLLLGVAVTSMMVMGAQAQTQDTDDEETEEDVVITTGIRQSIADSLDLKRGASGIIEAITAEDIGKLPDVSIADSLARLPGVTAQRVRGRAQQISIRGLGPDFSLALLNGREVVSAGSNRGIEFDQFPSELIYQGVVYKTPDASLAATGIAGAVDLRTVRPLDFNESQLNVSARYIYNDNGSLNPDFDASGYRLFGSYIGQNDDGTIGYSVGITHQTNPTHFFSRELKTGPGQTFATPGGSLFPADNPRTGVVSRDFERTSIAGALQFEPNDQLSATIDGFYSDFSDAGIFRGVETPLARWAGVGDGRGNPPAFPQTTGTGAFVDSAVYTQGSDGTSGIGKILRTDTEGAEVDLFAIGANVEYDFQNGWGVMLDAAYSELDRDDVDYESYAGTGSRIFGSFDFGPGQTYNPPRDPSLLSPLAITLRDNGEYSFATGIDYSDPGNVVLADPGGWGQVGFINAPSVEDELTQLRGEIDRELVGFVPFVEKVTLGGLYTERTKSFDLQRTFLRPGPTFDALDGAPIPESAILGQTDSGSINFDIVAYDPAQLVEDGTYVLEAATGPFYSIDEEIFAIYGMLDIGSDASRLKGNIGLRYEDVTQGSEGAITTLAGVAATQQFEDTYTHLLPTLNLSYEISDDVVVRGGAGQSVTRPRLDDLAGNLSVGFNNTVCIDSDGDQIPDQFNAAAFNPPTATCLGFGGGNPFLRPYESTYVDTSIEWYFSPAGALSIAGFYKDLSEYVQGFNSIVTDDDTVIAAGLDAGFVGANPDVATFSIGGPTNIGSGSLLGVEVALRLPFDDFIDTPFLEGFGFNGSVGYTDSSLDFNGNTIDIPGFSETVASGEVYYERNGFRARVNTAYRSEYLAGLIEFNGQPITDLALSRTTVDAQVGYEFQRGPLEGLSVNVEAYNLTDAPFRTEDNGFVDRREDYGTTYQFTVAKKF